ncbi:hypothetical protein [Rhodovulum sp. P5]|uniref:capsular polysaccharide export protein, LipB/KpsS family n=1 Tax=Rhodovulum sp. P5 TaxID=1564506 RepID=UPI0009DA7E74|nr:hypothetical protein [Rhodovulum sp. P5]
MRIGLNPGDRLFWPGRAGRYLAYRGTPADFGAYLEQVLADSGATDLVMLGDGRTHHRAAIAAIRASGRAITPWIVEQGYLRPGLILVETWGTGGRSRIPAAFKGQDTDALPDPAPAPGSFLRYAAFDVAYHLANVTMGPLFYPRYRHYALDSPVAEWRGWIGKALAARGRRRDTETGLARIAAHRGPVFLMPLQLDTDFQLRDHGTGRSQAEELEAIIASFRNHAPENALLVVKEHPLDNGLRRWGHRTRTLARGYGTGGRVVFLAGGRVEDLFPRLSGVVTINSTVGLSAILAGIPVKVLGRAIYDRPGLTHRGTLDTLWHRPEAPDADLAGRFRRYLRYHYHVPGAFDGPDALTGAENVAQFIAGEWPE